MNLPWGLKVLNSAWSVSLPSRTSRRPFLELWVTDGHPLETCKPSPSSLSKDAKNFKWHSKIFKFHYNMFI